MTPGTLLFLLSPSFFFFLKEVFCHLSSERSTLGFVVHKWKNPTLMFFNFLFFFFKTKVCYESLFSKVHAQLAKKREGCQRGARQVQNGKQM